MVRKRGLRQYFVGIKTVKNCHLAKKGSKQSFPKSKTLKLAPIKTVLLNGMLQMSICCHRLSAQHLLQIIVVQVFEFQVYILCRRHK